MSIERLDPGPRLGRAVLRRDLVEIMTIAARD